MVNPISDFEDQSGLPIASEPKPLSAQDVFTNSALDGTDKSMTSESKEKPLNLERNAQDKDEEVSASGEQRLHKLSPNHLTFDKMPSLSNISDSDSDEYSEDQKEEENFQGGNSQEVIHKDWDLEEDLRRAQKTISDLLELLNDNNVNTRALKKEIEDARTIRKKEKKELRDLKKAHRQLQMELVEHKHDVSFLEQELQEYTTRMKQDMFRLRTLADTGNHSLHDSSFHEILLVEY